MLVEKSSSIKGTMVNLKNSLHGLGVNETAVNGHYNGTYIYNGIYWKIHASIYMNFYSKRTEVIFTLLIQRRKLHNPKLYNLP